MSWRSTASCTPFSFLMSLLECSILAGLFHRGGRRLRAEKTVRTDSQEIGVVSALQWATQAEAPPPPYVVHNRRRQLRGERRRGSPSRRTHHHACAAERARSHVAGACAPRDQPRGLWARRSQACAPPYHSYQVGFQSYAFRRVRPCRSFVWRPGPRIGSATHRAAKPRLSPSAIIIHCSSEL